MGIYAKWTEEEDAYLKNNYSIKKISDLSLELKRTKNSIKNRLQKLSLKLNQKEKILRYENRKQKFPINTDIFCKPEQKHFLLSGYLLGFLWADGYVCKKHENRKENKICIYIASEDMEDIKDLYFISGNWQIYKKNHSTRKSLTRIQCHSKKLYDFLEDLDFKNKSEKSPIKILQNKNVEYKRGFWRGFIDGDGCYYFNPLIRKKVISVSGTLNQDWTSYIELLNELKIKFSIIRKKINLGGRSEVRINKSKDLLILINYIYPNKKYDSIGLKRKFYKAKKMKIYLEKLIKENSSFYKS